MAVDVMMSVIDLKHHFDALREIRFDALIASLKLFSFS